MSARDSLQSLNALRDYGVKPNRAMRRKSKRANRHQEYGTLASTWTGIQPELVVYGEYCANRRRGSHK